MIDRIRNWRLPVRYRVPPRNDLIAFALMALAFGLMVGLAIAPGWGNAGSTGPVIALPGGESAETGATGEEEAATVADLQPPAGGEVTTTASNDAPVTSTDTTTDSFTSEDPPLEDPVETPSENYVEPPGDPDPEDPDPDPEPETKPALAATVLGADDAGYAVADGSGNLLYIHYPKPVEKIPAVGGKIGTGINPLDNGTFVQFGGVEDRGSASSSKISGMVSFIDSESGVIAVSSRGASIAIAAAAAMAKSSSPPELGSWVTGTVSFGKSKAAVEEGEEPTGEPLEDPISIPSIIAKRIEAEGDPLGQIEMTGPVAWEPATRTLLIGADGFGVLNREIEIKVPKKLALKEIEDGLSYATSADLTSAGTLNLAGLSANFSLEAARDQQQAFGTHAR